MSSIVSQISKNDIQNWLIEKFSIRLGVSEDSIDVNLEFVDFNLDSVEALLLTGELEKWLNIEMQPTAMWYHPTLNLLAQHIAEDILPETEFC